LPKVERKVWENKKIKKGFAQKFVTTLVWNHRIEAAWIKFDGSSWYFEAEENQNMSLSHQQAAKASLAQGKSAIKQEWCKLIVFLYYFLWCKPANY